MSSNENSDVGLMLGRWVARVSLVSAALLAALAIAGHVVVSIASTSGKNAARVSEQMAMQGSRLAEVLFYVAELDNEIVLGDSYKFRQEIERLLHEFVTTNDDIIARTGVRQLKDLNLIVAAMRDTDMDLATTVNDFEVMITEDVLKTNGRLRGNTAGRIFATAQYSLIPAFASLNKHLRDEASKGATLTLVARLGTTTLVIFAVLGAFLHLSQRANRKFARYLAPEEDEETDKELRYDIVTGLPNRHQMQIYVKELGAMGRDGDLRAAVVQVRTTVASGDGETATERVADELFREIGHRISSVCRGGDFIACIAPGEFVVVASTYEDHRALHDLAEAVHTRITMPLQGAAFAGYAVSCRVGVAFMSPSSRDAQALLNNASIALAEAQRSEFSEIQFFSPDMKSNADRRQKLHEDLQAALKSNQIAPHFQPIVDTKTGTVVGLEALARWNHPEMGELAPIQFLDVAEEFELSQYITRVMLTEALASAQAWTEAGIAAPMMAFNITARQLIDGLFVDDVSWIIDSYGADPTRIALEISEKDLVNTPSELCAPTLRRLAEIGFQIFIDDFGSGLIDIGQLKALDVRQLKIDQAFVANIDTANDQQAHVAAIIRHAAKLGIEPIAKGVETETERLALKRLDCPVVQGFLIAQPMSADKMRDWLRDNGAQPEKPNAA